MTADGLKMDTSLSTNPPKLDNNGCVIHCLTKGDAFNQINNMLHSASKIYDKNGREVVAGNININGRWYEGINGTIVNNKGGCIHIGLNTRQGPKYFYSFAMTNASVDGVPYLCLKPGRC